MEDNARLEYQLQREDYWMKTLCTVSRYGLNERTKFINQDSSLEKLFPTFSRYGKWFIETRSQYKITNHDLASDIKILFSFLKQLLLKYHSKECWKLFERFNKRDLKSLGRQTQNLLHIDFQKTMAWTCNSYSFNKII